VDYVALGDAFYRAEHHVAGQTSQVQQARCKIKDAVSGVV